MATTFLQLFAPVQLTNAAATYFTMPTSPPSSILTGGRIRFTNTDAAARTVTAYHVPAAGAAVAGNCFLNAVSIAPNQYLDVALPQMKAGDFLQAKADANAVITITPLAGVIIS